MLKYFVPISGMVSLLLFFGCQKEETVDRDYPRIRTAAVNEITDEGATFNATVLSGSMEAVSEYGFVWGTTDYLSVENSEKIIVTETPENSGFSCDITFALEAMKKYFVRAYVKAGEKVIYGDVVQFMSLGSFAPVLLDFEPKTASWGDTIEITGKNFSYQTNNIMVVFDLYYAKVIESSNEHIVVLVPDQLSSPQSELKVSMLGNTSKSASKFTLITYGRIDSFYPARIGWGDTLTLHGNFPIQEHLFGIKINGVQNQTLEITNNQIKTVFPVLPFKDSVKIELIVDNHIVFDNHYVQMKKPMFESLSTYTFGWEDTIIAKGYFHPYSSENHVFFNSSEAKILKVTQSQIQFIVPVIDRHNCSMTIKSNNIIINNNTPIDLSGPEISSISPSKTSANGRIIIKGKYFHTQSTFVSLVPGSSVNIASVKSREIVADFVGVTQNGACPVTVTVFSKSSTVSNLLTIANPRITGLSHNYAFFGDIVTISGENFDPTEAKVRLCNDVLGEIVSVTPTEIKFTVPTSIYCGIGTLSVETSGISISSNESFYIYSPIINSINPESARAGDIIEISGDYFNPDAENGSVYIGNLKSQIIGGDRYHIEVRIPNLPAGTYTVEVSNGSSGIYGNTINIISPWKLIGGTSSSQNYGVNLLYNNTLYQMGGMNEGWYYFQKISLQNGNSELFPKALPTTGYIFNNCGFVIGNKAFFGIGNKDFDFYVNDFFSYDLIDGSWNIMKNFPDTGRAGTFSFSINGKGYMGTGMNNTGQIAEVWEYTPESDNWSQKGDFPGGGTTGASAVVYNNKAYIIDGKNLWLYDPSLDQWVKKAQFPGIGRKGGVAVVLGDIIYYGTGSEPLNISYYNNKCFSDLWIYSISNNVWTQISNLPAEPRASMFGYTWDGKIYLGGGISVEPSGQDRIRYEIFEYDPDF